MKMDTGGEIEKLLRQDAARSKKDRRQELFDFSSDGDAGVNDSRQVEDFIAERARMPELCDWVCAAAAELPESGRTEWWQLCRLLKKRYVREFVVSAVTALFLRGRAKEVAREARRDDPDEDHDAAEEGLKRRKDDEMDLGDYSDEEDEEDEERLDLLNTVERRLGKKKARRNNF